MLGDSKKINEIIGDIKGTPKNNKNKNKRKRKCFKALRPIFTIAPPVQQAPWGQLNKKRDKEGSPYLVTTALILSEPSTSDIHTK